MLSYRADAPRLTLCANCGKAANHICWDNVLPDLGRVKTYCDSCCIHSDVHDEDWSADHDMLDRTRNVEVTVLLEVYGQPDEVDKLIKLVDKEMVVRFGNMYKGLK